MKNKNLRLCVICAFLITGIMVNAQWQPVGPVAFTPGEAEYTSMTLTRDTPVIAFRDDAHNGNVSVMKYNGTGWNLVGPAGFSAYPVASNNLVLAADSASGKLYVAYLDSALGFRVYTWTGGAWDTVGYLAQYYDQQDELCLAIAADGTPYIAFRDFNHTYAASVMKYAAVDTGWSFVGNPDFSPSGGVDNIALAINQAGVPFLAVADGNTDTMYVQTFNGTNWINYGNYGFSRSNYAIPVSIAFGPNNLPYVALNEYTSNGPDGGVNVWAYNGSAWTEVGGQEATIANQVNINIKVSKQGVPVISYTDQTGTNQISVSAYTGGAWVNVGSADFSASTVEYPTLAISSTGNIYVGYEDDINSHAATVEEYKIGTAISNVTNITSFKIFPNPNNGQFQVSIQASDNDNIQLSLINTLGQAVWQNNAQQINGVYTTTVNAGALAAGVYVLQARTSEGVENRLIDVK